ncbi:DNA primase [Paenibacillus anaericanus]|uniref:DNA primase n=1 Tax=Paenibacillus anaericanus TaxID=170367 RepID=A0A433XXC3_9BACL|nr:phage/plasmid primase, P4 family [Paenibacillus anaericanus]RUT39407.1 DNA primase [Paenibacillus anaericanus]
MKKQERVNSLEYSQSEFSQGHELNTSYVKEKDMPFSNGTDAIHKLSKGSIGDEYASAHDMDFNTEDPESFAGSGNPSDSYLNNQNRQFGEMEHRGTPDLKEKNILLGEIIADPSPAKEIDCSVENSVPLDYMVTQTFINENAIKCFNDTIYIYDEKHGYYKEINESQVYVAIRKTLPPEIDMKLSKNKIIEVIHRLRSNPDLHVELNSFDSYVDLINFRDCVLDVQKREVRPHSSEFMFTSYIDADFEETPGIRTYKGGKRAEGRSFEKFLNDCTEGDQRKMRSLQQVMGYIISNEWRAKKFFVLVGAPHTGKSVWLWLYRMLIGENHTTAMSLKQLGETRFMTAELFKSKLNVTAEMDESSALKGTDIIKAVTGGDLLTAERKGEHPFRFYAKTKLVACGNSMPLLSKMDGTSAFIDRLLFLTFNNTIPEEKRDKRLMEKLLEEKHFIVKWAVQGMYDLLDNDLVFEESEDAIRFKESYSEELNSVSEFIRERCIVDPGNHAYSIHRKNLYDAYVYHTRSDGSRAVTKEEFYVEIKKLGVLQAKFRLGGNPLIGYKGIKLVPHKTK